MQVLPGAGWKCRVRWFFSRKLGKKQCLFLTYPFCWIHMRNNLEKKKNVKLRQGWENAMEIMSRCCSGCGEMSPLVIRNLQSYNKNLTIQNTSILDQKNLKEIRGLCYCIGSQTFFLINICKENSIFMFHL